MMDPRGPGAPGGAPGYPAAPGTMGTGPLAGSAPMVVAGPPGGPLDTEAPGFGAGVGSLFSGLKFVTSNPSVWPYAMVPVIFVVVITLAIGLAGAGFLPKLVVPMLGAWAHKGHGALGIVVKVLVTALSFLIGGVLGFALSQPLSGPALEKIVRKVEGTLGVPSWPQTSIAQDIWRSLEGLLLTTSLSLPIFALLFLIEFVFPPAAIVTVPLKIALTGLVLAWDLCDYPLSIRGMAIGARVALLRRHLPAVFGFGLGLALLSLIPCALLLVLPIGAAGATRLVVRLERWDTRSKLLG
jgi:CysZ protein